MIRVAAGSGSRCFPLYLSGALMAAPGEQPAACRRRNSPAGQGGPALRVRGRLGGRRVVLVSPRTTVFHETLNFRFADDHDLEMACFPFNVADSAGTISAMMRDLLR